MAAVLQPIKGDIGLGSWGNQATAHGAEGASQTYKMGALLINSGGSLIEATTTAVGTYSGIVGIAAANATGITGADCPYLSPSPDSFAFSITVDNALSAGTAPGTGALTSAGRYGYYSIQKDSTTGFWYLVVTNTTYPACTVTNLIDPSGTINGRVRIRFLHNILEVS